MPDDIAKSFAVQFKLPLPVVRQLTAEVAQRCALIANRYEPEGAFTFEQLAAVETLGAEIGSSILAQFTDDDRPPPEQTALDAGWGTGTR